MTVRQEMNDLVRVLESYFDGLYFADSKILSDVFHREARYVNTVEGDYVNYSVAEYFEVVDGRKPPASDGQVRADRVLSIEFGSPQMAFAKVAMTMMGRNYLDYLTLVKENDAWRIMAKVFSYTPTTREK